VNQPRPNQAPDVVWQIKTLAESAQRLAAAGEAAEAEKIYRTILETAPYHLAAINYLVARDMERGNYSACEELLERALRAMPERAMLHQKRAQLHKVRGDLDSAIASLDKALELDPGLRGAQLHKGEVLEALCRQEEAVTSYWKAWGSFPTADQLNSGSLAPPKLRPLANHSAEVLRRTMSKLLDRALAPLEEKYSKAALAGVREAAQVYIGERMTQYVHALQRPSYIHLPKIEPRAFFDRSLFPWIPKLEAALPAIRSELEAALASGEGLAPYVQIDAADPMEWRELNHSAKWNSLHLMRGGKWIEANRTRCPETSRVLETLPLAHIGDHAPEALFSILQPGTHIPPHHGLGNYKLVLHLPLIVPEGCSIRVGNETRAWKEGECLVFDDSFQHEAWNRGSETRTVLIMDIWNPLLSEAEREGMVALVGAIKAFNDRYSTTAA
jgi:aspartate beta-hydroxylase